MEIKVNADNQNQRLDKFLTEQLSLTRSQIKKMILNGSVLIDQKPATVHHFLKDGEMVGIQEKKEVKKILTQKPFVTELFSKIKIVAEEKDFLVIEKPADLLVHGTEKNETNTLADWLVSRYPEIGKIGEDPQRPGLVHRLDKEVSGLMLIPKNQDSFDYFKALFKERRIHKKYLALVYGQLTKEEDEINFPIGRSKTKPGLFAAHPKNHGESLEKDRSAITKIATIKKFKHFTLLEVEIMTGRTHQIRVHLLAYGHPIVGDRLYWPVKFRVKSSPGRIFLHAHQLSFTAPDGKEFSFQSPLPKELERYLLALKPYLAKKEKSC
ncbi:MAG: RluA family pseudouridine synthase [Patescibacteria group bacterium]